MFQNQSEHYWCILFRLNRPDGLKYVQSHNIVVMRTKYCRPLSKPKSVPLSYWESEAEQTHLLLFALTKGNVKHCIPGGEISQIKRYITWDLLIIFLKYQFPAARKDLRVLQKLNISCKVLPSHSKIKVSETDFEPELLLVKIQEGMDPFGRSLQDSRVQTGEDQVVWFLSQSQRFWFSMDFPEQFHWHKTEHQREHGAKLKLKLLNKRGGSSLRLF